MWDAKQKSRDNKEKVDGKQRKLIGIDETFTHWTVNLNNLIVIGVCYEKVKADKRKLSYSSIMG